MIKMEIKPTKETLTDLLEGRDICFEEWVESRIKFGLDKIAYAMMTLHGLDYDAALHTIYECRILGQPHHLAFVRAEISLEERERRRDEIKAFVITKYRSMLC